MAGESKFTKLGTTLADLDLAWKDRLADADTLLEAGRHAAAIASGLYALEIYLKTRICRKLDQRQLPSAFEIHDLDGLLLLAGLERRMNRKAMIGSDVKENWDEIRDVARTLNNLRYQPDRRWTRAQAASLLTRLNDAESGILAWLSRQR